MSRESYEQAVAAQRAQHIVEDFDRADLSRWTRSAGEASARAEYELADADHGKALHVKIGHLGGWETLTSPALGRPFPSEPDADLFPRQGRPAHAPTRARMEGRQRLALDCDGGLDARSGRTTRCCRTGSNRGRCRPGREARALPAGKGRELLLSAWRMSHTALEGDQHEYWFDDLGTAPNPFGDDGAARGTADPGAGVGLAKLPVFPDHDAGGGGGGSSEGGAGGMGGRWLRRTAQARTRCPLVGLNPRARGVGFEQGRAYRWEPLLGAYDAANRDYRGALGALVVNVEPPFRGSVWAVFTPAEASFYRQPVVTNCLRQVLSRMKRGVFLSEGGSEFFTVFAGQQFKAGARVVNFGKADGQQPAGFGEVPGCQRRRAPDGARTRDCAGARRGEGSRAGWPFQKCRRSRRLRRGLTLGGCGD